MCGDEQFASTLKSKSPRRIRSILLVIVTWVLVTLACADTDVMIQVEPGSDGIDRVTDEFTQHLSQAYLQAAQQAETDRKVDYEGAGLSYQPLFPMNASDADLFQSQKTELESQGYSVVMDDTGYTGTRYHDLVDEILEESWSLKVTSDETNPKLRTYTFSLIVDLTEVDMNELDETFNSGLPDKPAATAGGGSSGSGGSGGIGGLFDAFGDVLDAVPDLDMYYIQKVLQESGLPAYRYNITLPGKVIKHSIDGQEVGSLQDGTVTLALSESFLRKYVGGSYQFEVQSLYLDCTDSCIGSHMILDPTSEGASCDCVCEKGWELVEGTDACTHCQTFCEFRDPNFEYDPDTSETNVCACRCKSPLVLNSSGTGCIEPDPESDSATGDRMEGIIQVVLLGEEGHLWDIPGWDDLSRDEQQNLENLVEVIRVTLGLSQEPALESLSPYGSGHPCEGLPGPEACALYLAQQSELARDKYMFTYLTQRVQDELDRRKRIQGVIINEIKGNSKFAFYLTDAITWWGRRNMTAAQIAQDLLQKYASDKIKKSLLGTDPRDQQAAAQQLIKWLPEITTNQVVEDYYFYQAKYQEYIKEGNSEEDARRLALDQTGQKIQDSYYGFGRYAWFDSGVYASAFEKLDRSVGGGIE